MPTEPAEADAASVAAHTPATAPEDDAPDLVILDPRTVRLFRTGGSAVRMTVEGSAVGADRTYVRVQIARAFPLSMPDRHIGFRDAADHDIGLLPTLEGLDPESRRIADEELDRRYFLPKLVRVLSAKEEYGTVTWEAETDRGRRTFVLQNLRESVQTLSPSTRVLVTDKDGNRFEVPDVSRLDAKTRAMLGRAVA
jgi:hypothetical protein